MAENNRQVNIKKVQPYPFEIIIERGGVKGKVDALKLVLQGVIIDIKELVLLVGENISMELYLPADNGFISVKGKVVKTYDHFKGAVDGSKARRMAEVQFLNQPLPDKDKKKIKEFLTAIGQDGSVK